MSIMKKFTAQQLTKKQMNKVIGGDGRVDECGQLFHCTWSGGENYICEKSRNDFESLVNTGAICLLV